MISRQKVTTRLGISWRVSVGRGDSMPALLHALLASRLSSYTSELLFICFYMFLILQVIYVSGYASNTGIQYMVYTIHKCNFSILTISYYSAITYRLNKHTITAHSAL